MRKLTLLLVLLAMSPSVFASGRLGFYGIIEKVVFEPNETAPERIQLWGAFAYADGAPGSSAASPVKKGYLYFRLKSDIPGFTSDQQAEQRKKEWADLKALAGTGQAIAFGSWGYIGGFGGLQPDTVSPLPSYLYENKPAGGAQADLRVRPATEKPSNPATYQTDTGIVKLSDTGSRAAIVQQLKDALKR